MKVPVRTQCRLLALMLICACARSAKTQEVMINEIMTAPSERQLIGGPGVRPHLGPGGAWFDPEFDDQSWAAATPPMGFGHEDLATDLGRQMVGQTCSLYLRKVFSLSEEALGFGPSFVLAIDYEDGFIAYLNGQEVARRNLGQEPAFVYHDQPAYNERFGRGEEEISLAGFEHLLKAGDNTLAIQVHNRVGEFKDTFRFGAALTINAMQPVEIIGRADRWRCFVGVTEPSGGLADLEVEGDPDFIDWIELHNPGTTGVSLMNWSITDTRRNDRKWVFPDIQLEGGGYLVLLASGHDVRIPEGRFLHTNFKLDAEGEYLGLFDAGGRLVHELGDTPLQVFTHSYGIAPGSNELVYFDVASPGSANQGNTFIGVAAPPRFGCNPGFYAHDLLLDLFSDQDDVSIRYTTDGTEPALGHGTEYTASILLTDSTAVRARSFKAGWIPSPTVTRTYLIKEPAALQSMLSISLVADPNRSLYAPHGVTSIVGGSGLFGAWRALNSSDYNIPLNRGRAFEKPGSLELFPPHSGDWYQDDIGIRISGSRHTRGQYLLTHLRNDPWYGFWREKPSLSVFFRKDYGEGRLEFPWVSGYDQTRFESLKLRAGKVDWENPFIVDEFMRRLFVDMGQVGSMGELVNLFVNAEFKCYYNLAERIREPFLQMRHASSAPWDVIADGRAEEGDVQAWDEMLSFFSRHSIKTLSEYQTAEGTLDLVNFIDYLLVNIYGANWDWPEQNYVAARERKEGARFQFYVWDAEASLDTRRVDPTVHDAFTDVLRAKDPAPVPLIYQAISASPEFRLLFADRVQAHFFHEGALTTSRLSGQLTLLAQALNPSMQYVRAGDEVHLGPLLDWVDTRGTVLLSQFAREGLWPSTLAPDINQLGGDVSSGFEMVLSNTNLSGDIYFTMDGTDPRSPGGYVQGSRYIEPIVISQDSTLNARVHDGREWSPLLSGSFTVKL